METLQEKIARVVAERVEIVPYDPRWPDVFEAERDHLLACLPSGLIGRIEHFGSTAVPGLVAKPVVDMLVEVSSLEQARQIVPPIFEPQGYDYFWRPNFGDDGEPFYCFLIKRDDAGQRTHHIHMVEAHFEHWDRLVFRDYLRQHPQTMREYADLKLRLAQEHPDDRVAYTEAKGEFIRRVTEIALGESSSVRASG